MVYLSINCERIDFNNVKPNYREYPCEPGSLRARNPSFPVNKSLGSLGVFHAGRVKHNDAKKQTDWGKIGRFPQQR